METSEGGDEGGELLSHIRNCTFTGEVVTKESEIYNSLSKERWCFVWWSTRKVK